MKIEILEMESPNGKISLVLKIDNQIKRPDEETIKSFQRYLGKLISRLQNYV